MKHNTLLTDNEFYIVCWIFSKWPYSSQFQRLWVFLPACTSLQTYKCNTLKNEMNYQTKIFCVATILLFPIFLKDEPAYFSELSTFHGSTANTVYSLSTIIIVCNDNGHTEQGDMWMDMWSSNGSGNKKEELCSIRKLKIKRKYDKCWWISTFSFGSTSPSCPVAWVWAWVSDWAWARLPRVFIITAITFSCTRRILIRSGCWKNVWLFTSFLLNEI